MVGASAWTIGRDDGIAAGMIVRAAGSLSAICAIEAVEPVPKSKSASQILLEGEFHLCLSLRGESALQQRRAEPALANVREPV
jgi:hypothetical protein